MFELFTEKARRSIFFARYEASHFGCPYIETEHLLLALLPEHRDLVRLLPPDSAATIRKQTEAHTVIRQSVSTSVDLPLSNESKRVLAYAAEEARRLGLKHTGTEHLSLGFFGKRTPLPLKSCKKKDWLSIGSENALSPRSPTTMLGGFAAILRAAPPWKSMGRLGDTESIRERVTVHRGFDWYWHKRQWKACDLVLHKPDGTL